ncbi:extracellular solute-binding protein [Oceanospirillaceae bacterium]|jgi:ABC-type glycerol-3-phosphate transport system substrate-binding protein|nr:extracellular solute-binding protein [Oceanospirillaceae bacterium]MBT5628823.1 extracellular solute-binding protein [Oceanospirillaceae bacterium]MBT7673375.1 extracellular solute-binding protein [Oceanospirillaceae bacterium]MDB9904595.1 extracellular solute-binding protein [Oceanospirillaceae bacterium]
MGTIKTIALTAAAAAVLTSSSAFAGCGINGNANVSILGNDFPALHAVFSAAEQCAGDGVTVTKNHNKDYKDFMVPALTVNPSEYSALTVSNGTLVTLMNDDLVRPLDDLVAKHGQALSKTQLVTVNGQVMAVAFMANAQHLFYRSDILSQVGMGADDVQTYEQVLSAAKKIRAAGIMEYPVALNTKAGWNLGEEFINMYLGTGADMFKPGTAQVSINNAHGVASLNMLKQLAEYSHPDFLTFDSNTTQAMWEGGKLALATMWGSRTSGVLDDEGSTKEVVMGTEFASAPSFNGGTMPASSLWWDGFIISKNVSDADAEASFIAMMNGISPAMVQANNDAATWLIKGYKPSKASSGVTATAMNGAAPYPMLPFIGALHGAAGSELSDFLQGKESANQALADMEAAYNVAAKEKGFL